MFLSPETSDEATAVPLYAFAKLYNASESEANDFIEKANLQGDIKLGRTNKPYDLYKVDTQAGPCYLTKQYIEWLLWDSVMNNKDINKKLPSRLIIRP